MPEVAVSGRMGEEVVVLYADYYVPCRGRGGRTLADSGAGRGRNQSRGRGQRYTTSTLAPVQETSP